MGADEYREAVGSESQSVSGRPSHKENRAVIYSIIPDYRTDLYPKDTEYKEKKKKKKFPPIDGNPYLLGFRKFYTEKELERLVGEEDYSDPREEKEKEENKEDEEEKIENETLLDLFTFSNRKNIKQNQTKYYTLTHGNIQSQVGNNNDHSCFYQGDMKKIGGKLKRHGFGTFTTNKYIRVGTWRKDSFTGWGLETRTDGEYRYIEARFRDGKPFDRGMIVYEDGSVYEGTFCYEEENTQNSRGAKKVFKRAGNGKYETNLIRYEGSFTNDKFNGRGEIEFKNSGFKYEGPFLYGNILLKGNRWKFTFDEGAMIDSYFNRGDVERYKLVLSNLNSTFDQRMSGRLKENVEMIEKLKMYADKEQQKRINKGKIKDEISLDEINEDQKKKEDEKKDKKTNIDDIDPKKNYEDYANKLLYFDGFVIPLSEKETSGKEKKKK